MIRFDGNVVNLADSERGNVILIGGFTGFAVGGCSCQCACHFDGEERLVGCFGFFAIVFDTIFFAAFDRSKTALDAFDCRNFGAGTAARIYQRLGRVVPLVAFRRAQVNPRGRAAVVNRIRFVAGFFNAAFADVERVTRSTAEHDVFLVEGCHI